MIQLNEADVCRLIKACEYYKNETGSEYMWDTYNNLQLKLRAYGEEVTIKNLECPSES